MTIDDIKALIASDESRTLELKKNPYNQNMAQALYRSTLLESWGSGIHRIIEACREQGVEDPTWRWDGGFVYVTFKRPAKYALSMPQGELNPDSNANEGESTQESIHEQGKSIEESIQESIQELKSNREKVILILSIKPGINLDEVARIIGLSRIGVQKIVGKLKAEGILSRNGSTKAGKWIVNKEQNL